MSHAKQGNPQRCLAWFEKRPLFAVVLVVVLGILCVAWSPWLGYSVALVAALIAGLGFHWRAGVGVLLVSGLAVTVYLQREGLSAEARAALPGLPETELGGVVLEDARGSERFWVAPVKWTDDGPWRGQRVWWQGKGVPPIQGTQIRARGRFAAFAVVRNPGEFDQGLWLKRMGMVALFHPGVGTTERFTPGWAESWAGIRRGFRERLTIGLDRNSTEAQLIRAVVIGERPSNADDLVEAFRFSGTLHAFSVSGLHVAMVATMVWFILGWIGVPRRWAALGVLPLIFGYAWLTGADPPAVRAAWMAAVFITAFGLRRKPDLLNTLGFVLLVVLLWDGRILFQPGVQLSYGVIAVMAIGTPWVARWFSWIEAPELHLPDRQMSWFQRLSLRSRRWLAQSLSVSVAAGIGTTPLTLFHFGLLTPISVLAGLVLVPLIFLLLLVGLASVVLSPAGETVSRMMNQSNAWIARGCVLVAEGFAAIPGGHFQLGKIKQPMLLVYDLDRGDQAACFADTDGSEVMLDCGGRRSFQYQVFPSLRSMQLQPDSVVFSHPDGGHLGGGPVVWDLLPLRQALMPVRAARSEAYRSWIEEAPKAGIRLHHADEVKSLPMPDGAVLEWLHVPDPDEVNGLADNRVLVARLHWRGWKLLWTSDAGMRIEQAMLDAGIDLTADVIIAGKHRSDLSLSDPFVRAVNPQVVVIGNDAYPAGERVDEQLISYWAGQGVQWVDQSQSGAATFTVDDAGDLCIRGHVDGRQWKVKAAEPPVPSDQ